MPHPGAHTVGPNLSWRLVHDGAFWYGWFRSVGYTTSIHEVEEFGTEAEGNERIAELGLVPKNPPHPEHEDEIVNEV